MQLITYLLKCNNNKTNKNVDHKEGYDDNVDHVESKHVWAVINYTRTFTLFCRSQHTITVTIFAAFITSQ